MRTLALVAVLPACTWGLGEEISFRADELSVSAQVGDTSTEAETGSIDLLPLSEDLTEGVYLVLRATGDEGSIVSTLNIEGDFGALCPGSEVRMERRGDLLETTSASGAPRDMVFRLQALQAGISQEGQVGDESVATEPDELTITSSSIPDSVAARVEITSVTLVDDVPHRVQSSFTLARIQRDRELGDVEVAWD